MKYIYKFLYFLLPRLRFIKKVKGCEYLDFGCGNGTVLSQNLIVRPNLNISALDIKNFASNMPDKAVFKVYDGKNIPFEDGKFDIITVNHVLEHVKDPDEILWDLKRVLKPNGHIYLEVPNERSLLGKPYGKYAGTIHFKDDSTHVRTYSKNDLIKLFEKFNFRVVKAGIARNILHLLLSPVLLIAGILMPRKLYYMYARNSIIGWASYIIVTK